MEEAIEWLRHKGIAKADKEAGRIVTEGLVDTCIQSDGRLGVLIEVNCQTDFLAHNKDDSGGSDPSPIPLRPSPKPSSYDIAELPSAANLS